MSIVYLKNKKNGVTYVYESRGYWDKEKQQARNNRVCIGKLDPDTGEFVPSKRLAAQDASTAPGRGPVPCVECSRSFYGATYLFDAIGARLGITDDLRRCFPDIYKQILSVAYYLILEDRNPMSRFPEVGIDSYAPIWKEYPLPEEQRAVRRHRRGRQAEVFPASGKPPHGGRVSCV
jgi:hypothetical protein